MIENSHKLDLRSRIDDSYMEQSSYVMEQSIGTDMEFSTINRLLADFNINRDSSMSQKRSPLKMLKITGDLLHDVGPSYQLEGSEGVNDYPNTSNARAQGNLKRFFLSNRQFFIFCL